MRIQPAAKAFILESFLTGNAKATQSCVRTQSSAGEGVSCHNEMRAQWKMGAEFAVIFVE